MPVINPIDPISAIRGGFELGTDIRSRQQMQSRNLASSQAMDALVNNHNATPEDYSAVVARFPELRESVQQIMQSRQVESQKGRLADIAEEFPTRPGDITQLLLQNPELATQITSAFDYQQRQALLDQQQMAAQAQQAQKVEMQQDLANLATKNRPSAQDYSSMILKYPQLSKQIQDSYSMLSEERQQSEQDQSLKLFAAMEAGQMDVVERILENQITAAENSGDEEARISADSMLKLVKTNPDAAKTAIGLELTAVLGPDKFTNVYTTLKTEERKKELQPKIIEKMAADLGLTKAQTNKALADARKLDAETQESILKLEKVKLDPSATVDPKDRFKLEMDLRKESEKSNKNYIAIEEAYRKINAARNTAAGDISLIFSFMKLLDPTSVVREGEQATMQNSGSVGQRIINIYNRALTGERLTKEQRADFKGQSKDLLFAAQKGKTENDKRLRKIVSNYGLNPEHVFLEKTRPVRRYLRYAD